MCTEMVIDTEAVERLSHLLGRLKLLTKRKGAREVLVDLWWGRRHSCGHATLSSAAPASCGRSVVVLHERPCEGVGDLRECKLPVQAITHSGSLVDLSAP